MIKNAIVLALGLFLAKEANAEIKSYPASQMGTISHLWMDDCTGRGGNAPVVWFKIKEHDNVVFGFYGNTDIGKIWLSTLMTSMSTGLGFQVTADDAVHLVQCATGSHVYKVSEIYFKLP